MFTSDDESAAQLERCLFDDTLPIDVRAAGALILLYGLTPGRVRRLRQDQLAVRDGETYLRIETHQLIVPPRLAALLRQLPRPANRTTLAPKPSTVTHLFPARALDRPADATAFYARLKRHGITTRGGRNTALINLAGDLPAPVLAQMLGLHIATAVRWAKYAKRDWETYLAQRRADRDLDPEAGAERGPRTHHSNHAATDT